MENCALGRMYYIYKYQYAELRRHIRQNCSHLITLHCYNHSQIANKILYTNHDAYTFFYKVKKNSLSVFKNQKKNPIDKKAFELG